METYNLSDLSGKTLWVPHHTTFFVPWFLKKKDKKKFISVVANGLV